MTRKMTFRDRITRLDVEAWKPGFSMVVQMKLDVIAVVPLVWACHCLLNRRILDLANSLQLIAQNVRLGLQLHFMGYVLVVASSALAEMFAAGCDPPGCSLQDFNNFTRAQSRAFSSVNRMRTRSPGNPNGTKTARPSSRRPMASPPYVRVVRVSS